MSEIKVFRVEGSYKKDHIDYVFRKEKRAMKKEDAVELVLSEITSIGLFRRQINIDNVKELKKEEITDPLIIQLIDKQ
ncbi:MAG: 50S ribosomal protein L18a [archaeon]|nr:50S ribosomal protein L18a [archaeon]